LILSRAPATVDDELNTADRRVGCGLSQGVEERWVELRYAWDMVIEDRGAGGNRAVSLAKRTTAVARKRRELAARDLDR
jgi:hypothetical protein